MVWCAHMNQGESSCSGSTRLREMRLQRKEHHNSGRESLNSESKGDSLQGYTDTDDPKSRAHHT